jgi:hypothetical protein
MEMIFKYIVAGNGSKAVAVHSSLNLTDMSEYVRVRSKRVCEDGNDTVFNIGVIKLVNPRVYCPSDFADFSPYLIQMI